MENRNIGLKNAFFAAGITQRQVARETKIPENLLSLAIHGRFILDSVQKAKIARALGADPNDLFSQEG